MNRKFACAAIWMSLAAASVASPPALAHHSFAMFDHSHEVEIKDATVIEWQWTNPHCWLYVLVPNGSANPDKYTIEGANPAQLRRQGFAIGTFKPGDKVTIFIWPLLSGDKGGAMTVAVLPNGKTLGEHRKAVQ